MRVNSSLAQCQAIDATCKDHVLSRTCLGFFYSFWKSLFNYMFVKQKVDTRIPTEEDNVKAGTLIKTAVCVYWDEENG